jgi:hypothetical protein
LLAASAPAASARASSGSYGRSSTTRPATVGPLVAPGDLLSADELDKLLPGLPLSDLSTTQLAHYLARLEGIGALADLHVGLLGTEELGLAGLEEGLARGVEQLGGSATIGELTNSADLLPDVEGKLDGLLTALLGSALDETQQHGLSEALGTLDLDQLVGSLLGSAKEPVQLNGLSDLADGLFEKLGASTVEGLLGSTLKGQFAPTTVEDVAEELGATPEVVSDELGQTAAQLPATATMLTAPVTDGKLLAVVPAVKGLALGLLGASSDEEGNTGSGEGQGGDGSGEGGDGEGGDGSGRGGEGSGSGEGKGGQGSGAGGQGAGQGGSGGQASGASAGGVELVVNLPGAQTAISAPVSVAKAKPRGVEILRGRTKGAVATIVLQAPAAGRLTLSGSGLLSRSAKVRAAGRVTLKVRLSKAGAASLRRRGDRLRVRLRESFKPTVGASSSTTVVLAFK